MNLQINIPRFRNSSRRDHTIPSKLISVVPESPRIVDQMDTRFTTKELLELKPVYRETVKRYLTPGSTLSQWLSEAVMEAWNVDPKAVLNQIVVNKDILKLWDDKPRQQDLVNNIIVESLTTNDVAILERIGIAPLKGPFEF